MQLVTDRTFADVAYAEKLLLKVVSGEATISEILEFEQANLKGAYNYTDINRVNMFANNLYTQLKACGYALSAYKLESTNLSDNDSLTEEQRIQYITNIKELRNTMGVLATSPSIPDSLDYLSVNGANSIEQNLLDIQTILQRMLLCYVRSNAPNFYANANPLPTEGTYLGRTWEELDTLKLSWNAWDVSTFFDLSYKKF